MENSEFIKWCFENKALIELTEFSDFISSDDVIDARNECYSCGNNVSAGLFWLLMEVCVKRELAQKDEIHMYQRIVDSIGGRVLGGPSMPDCSVNGIPVEAKKMSFGMSALRQLQRYMKSFGSSYGIAAARSCSITLPENVFFLQLEYAKRSGYQVVNADEAKQWLSSKLSTA